MKKKNVKTLLNQKKTDASLIQIDGWVRSKRDYKDFTFLEINDGSTLRNLQIVIDQSLRKKIDLSLFNTGASVKIIGTLVESEGKNQKWEIKASDLSVYGSVPKDYPLQKKGHSLEFLREISHLRPRTNLFGSVFRLRSRLSYAVHQFFQERDFFYVHTPIISSSDCEGAGELFRVTALDMNNPPKMEHSVDYSQDFFGKSSYLTVSGQLEGECMALALSKTYTFGPTFRAENSNTKRHAAEFWMIEPEMAFMDLVDDMDVAEEFIKYLIKDTLTHSQSEMELFNKFISKGTIDQMGEIQDSNFERISYKEAIELLMKSKESFEYEPKYGINLQTEHERYLSEKHFKSPVFVFNYPKEIKPFYMKENDEGTVGAFDLLVPQIGEIIGGSQREESLDVLEQKMKEHHLDMKDYWWYLDTRRFGTAPHSGFGLGFERMIMMLTGLSNIRDVIPFFRTPGHVEF